MNTVSYIIMLTAVAGVGGTGLGGLLGAFFTRGGRRTVSVLLSFSGGVMLSVVCLGLIGDAVGAGTGSVPVMAWTLTGYCAVYLLEDFLGAALLAARFRGRGRPLFAAGLVMACAVALHNLPEGMVIGASYAGERSTGAGAALALVIGLHNIPEGMAVAVPLSGSGTSGGKAVFAAALAGAPTISGALLGYFLGTLSPVWYAASLSFSGGAMLYVVFGELLPESSLLWRSRLPPLAAMLGFLSGMYIIYM